MIYILLLIACPLLVVLIVIVFMEIVYHIVLMIPGIIVTSLLMMLAVELKSYTLGFSAVAGMIYWMFYIMKKIEQRTTEAEEERKRKYDKILSVRK